MTLFGNRPRAAAPSPNAIRADAVRSAKIDEYVNGVISPDGPGLALGIIKGGELVHAAGYGLADLNSRVPITPGTIFDLASCGKQFTAMAIMMLAEERKLQIDDPVGKHLPWLSGFGLKVTLRQLLYHTSGIRDLYDDDGADVLSRCTRATNADVMRTYVDLSCPMNAEPGDEFVYSNSGYDLLGSVIERVSGQSYPAFLKARIFDPLGMKDTFSRPDPRVNDPRVATGYVLGDRQGEVVESEGTDLDDVVGSGTIYSTVPDLFLYDQALAKNTLVSVASMREAYTSGQTNDGTRTDYGFGWYVGTYMGMHYADHDGEWIGYWSYICRYLVQPLSMYVLSNNPDVDLPEIANQATAIYR
jgi:CubicO group peptidase (beta-lactamase class C family)